MERIRVHRSKEYSEQHEMTSRQADEMAARDTDKQAATEHATELDEATSELLDEIDSVLEANAAEFVNGYEQEGGE